MMVSGYCTNMGYTEIKMMDADGTREHLEILEANEANRMLRV